MKRQSSRVAYGLVVAAVLALGLAACDGTPSYADARGFATALAKKDPHLSAGGASAAFDYEILRNTDEMLPDADIVATGTIASFSQGVITTDRFDYRPIVASVTNVSVLHGSLPADSDGNLYVALFGVGGPEGWLEAIPLGTPILIYGAAQLWHEDGMGVTEVREGLPKGQQLYGPVHPFGYVLEERGAAGPDLVFPWHGERWTGKELSAAFPGMELPFAL